jgi:hypothetical protein
MKSIYTFLVLTLFGFSFLSAQQIADNAIGLRIGDNDGLGAEITYQKTLFANNRLEFDLGWRNSKSFDAIKLAGLYQWVNTLDGDFNWFIGAGGGLGNVSFENKELNDGIFIFAAGNIGIEYNFDIPIVVSLDARPEIGLTGYDDFNNNVDFDIALSIRYQF